MQTVTINRQNIRISASEKRVLEALASHNFVLPMSHFEAGWGKYRVNEALQALPYVYAHTPQSDSGAQIDCRPGINSRARKFFADNPRNQFCVTGDVRRINLVLARLNEGG